MANAYSILVRTNEVYRSSSSEDEAKAKLHFRYPNMQFALLMTFDVGSPCKDALHVSPDACNKIYTTCYAYMGYGLDECVERCSIM